MKGLASIGLISFALVTLTPIGAWMTTSLVGHVLVQIPLLVMSGVLLGARLTTTLSPTLDRWNAGGIPGLLLISFTLAFWMIPRWLDASLVSASVAWVKYSSLALLAGVPLVLSWPRLHPITKGLAKMEFLAMLLRLGWLYLISPERLCNNYLLNDQLWLGRSMILVAIALGITWLVPVFFGSLAAAPDDKIANIPKLD